MADLEIFSSRNYYHSCWLNGLKIARSSSYLFQACPLCGYQTNYGTPALDLSALAYSMVLGYICTGCIIAIYPLPSTFPARRLTIDGSCLGLRQDLVWHAIRLLRAFGGCRNEVAHEQGLCPVIVIEPQFCFWEYWKWAPFWKELFLYTCGTDDGSVIIAPWKQIHEDFYQRPSSKLFVSDRWSTHMLTPVILTICPSSSRQKGTVALVDLKKRGPRFILALLNRKHQIFMCHILSFTDQHPRLSEADTENWGASTK